MMYLGQRFGLACKRRIQLVELRRGHYLPGAAAFAEKNVGVADGIISFVQTAVFVLRLTAYDAISSFSKNLIVGKHRFGVGERRVGWLANGL